MRERLAKDKGATYTYSMDYVSQTVSLVDESRLKEDQEVSLDFLSSPPEYRTESTGFYNLN